MFNSSTDAAYQAESVKAYLAAAPQLPPAGSFPPAGRATPDVSALGEGYMVLMNGAVQPGCVMIVRCNAECCSAVPVLLTVVA